MWFLSSLFAGRIQRPVIRLWFDSTRLTTPVYRQITTHWTRSKKLFKFFIWDVNWNCNPRFSYYISVSYLLVLVRNMYISVSYLLVLVRNMCMIQWFRCSFPPPSKLNESIVSKTQLMILKFSTNLNCCNKTYRL